MDVQEIPNQVEPRKPDKRNWVIGLFTVALVTAVGVSIYFNDRNSDLKVDSAKSQSKMTADVPEIVNLADIPPAMTAMASPEDLLEKTFNKVQLSSEIKRLILIDKDKSLILENNPEYSNVGESFEIVSEASADGKKKVIDVKWNNDGKNGKKRPVYAESFEGEADKSYIPLETGKMIQIQTANGQNLDLIAENGTWYFELSGLDKGN